MQNIQTEIRELLTMMVAEGFATQTEMFEHVSDYFEGVPGLHQQRAFMQKVASDLLTAQAEKEEEWVTATDCDRLDIAFAELNQIGIVARQHFTCCQTCGHYEIDDEVRGAAKRQEVLGYVFYHQQDTASAVERGYLYLAFGAVVDAPQQVKLVGERVVQALRDVGLSVKWEGDINRRIRVALQWEKRRFSEYNVLFAMPTEI
ncbi:MAG TPA: hypothetical protein VLL52_19995 [Anaerolineae bacterium]|nr:hypothetical protein [Anaerolineae bacterium]